MTNESQNQETPKTSNKKMWIGGSVIAVVLASAIGAQAFTSSRVYQHLKVESGDVQNIGWHKRGHRNMSPEDIDANVTRAIKHLAIEIDANEEQQKQLIVLAKALVDDMMPMRDQMRATGKEIQKLLTAPTIDRDALEKIRVSKLADADGVSKKLVSALANAAEVLTPEQRATVAERIETFRSMRGRWHKG